ncbi:MAG: FAD-dependent oxidoreductase [Planctomycetota bacterium]
MKRRFCILSGFFVFLFFSSCFGQTVLVEAEGFEDRGGWVIDQQFMDQMGSAYLLAHGLGEPVADARTTVEFPKSGKYRVWVRTRDWVAPWGVRGAPGRFRVVIDGEAIETVFGTEGAEWGWQDGGLAEIGAGKVEIGLEDLTGFEGRCDAIVFTADGDFTPPNAGAEMAAFRRKALGLSAEAEEAGEYDLVVVGGGMAGTCAGISAARLGLSVALIQDRPVLGGNNSSEVRVWLGGKTNFEPYPRIGDVVKELDPKRRAHYGAENVGEIYEDENKEAVVRTEKRIDLFLMHRVNKVEVEEGRIRAVIAQEIRSGRRLRFSGRWFADCTGDGCVGYLAGADYDMTLKEHLGRSNLWYVVDTGEPVQFARCPWAIDLSEKAFPGREGSPGIYGGGGIKALGVWYWESGFYYDPIERGEYIRDLNFRAMYGAWDCLKNIDKAYANYKIGWAAYISGKRESRRLLGDMVLTKEDLLGGKVYEDGCVPASWDIDLHLPAPEYADDFGEDAFISRDYHTDYERPYWVPYRCLYSRNIENLFMAGRDISVTSEALGTVRVMRTTGMMGEVVGMAASLCKEHGESPRGIYENHLDELKELMKHGVGKEKPEEMVLFDFDGEFDVSRLEVNDAEVRLSNGRLRIRTEEKNPGGVVLKAPEGRWDLSDYLYLAMEVHNGGEREVSVSCRVDNPGATHWRNSSLGNVIVGAKQTETLKVHFKLKPLDEDSVLKKYLAGMHGLPGGHVWHWSTIDAAKINQIKIYVLEPKGERVIEIDNVRGTGLYKPPSEEELKRSFFPFVDEFGQYIHKDWPGKTDSVAELVATGKEEMADFGRHSGPSGWNRYGGWSAGPKLEATGHFRVEKYKGKWWLVDPEGRLFWSHGIDCINMGFGETGITEREHYFSELPDEDSPLGQFYGKGSWAKKSYGNERVRGRTYKFGNANLFLKYGQGWRRSYSTVTHKRLRSWGMNTIANWSSPEIYLQRKTPYVVAIYGYWGGGSVAGQKFPNVFDEKFRLGLRERMAREVGETTEDSWCIGYFVDNELKWGNGNELSLAVLGAGPEEAAKKEFVKDLKAKYKTVDKLNAAWGSEYDSWEALLASREGPDEKKAKEDLDAFLERVAERYFRICREEVKRAAEEKLYLGCRFNIRNPVPILVSAKYCDVMSYNMYVHGVRSFSPPEGVSKPVIIGEFHFGAMDRGPLYPGLRDVPNQAQRGAAYRSYVRGALENPYIVGTHWFQYKDQATTGRGDGENCQVGFLDICDRPYPETIAACREVGYSMYEYRLGTKVE